MRYLFKFAHTLGAIGLLGTMAGLLVVLALLPDPSEDIQTYAALTEVVDKLAATPRDESDWPLTRLEVRMDWAGDSFRN